MLLLRGLSGLQCLLRLLHCLQATFNRNTAHNVCKDVDRLLGRQAVQPCYCCARQAAERTMHSPFLPGANAICRAAPLLLKLLRLLLLLLLLLLVLLLLSLLPLLLDAPLGNDLPLHSRALGRIGCAPHGCPAAQQQPAASCAPQTCSREQQQQQQQQQGH